MIDLGSNTFHLLVGEVAGGRLKEVEDCKETVRLGEGAFTRGEIGVTAWHRGQAAVRALLTRAEGPVADVLMVATQVFREAKNGRAFLAEVERRYGVAVRLLSGEEEAQLTWRGIRSELEPAGPTALIDLGGGSVECALGEDDELPISQSVPLGVLRLKARFDPAGRGLDSDRYRELERHVLAATGPVLEAIRGREPEAVVLSSGTARALLKLARRLGYPEDVAGCLGRKTLQDIAHRLAALGKVGSEALGVAPSRADTLGLGAAALAVMVELLGASFVRIASRALREGVLLEALAAPSARVPGRVRLKAVEA